MDAKLESLVGRLEAAVTKLETMKIGGGGGAPAGDDDFEEYPSIQAYDTTFNPKLEQMAKAAKALGGDLVEMSEFVVQGFKEVRRLILLGERANKPDDMTAVLKPLLDVQNAGEKWCHDHFRTPFVNHEKAVHEALAIFVWPIQGAGAQGYVSGMLGAVETYTNKILMEFRGKDDNQVAWVQGIVGAFKQLPEYIQDFHKTGMQWNARAPKATAPAKMKGEGSAPAAAAPAAAPAPAPKKEEPKPAAAAPKKLAAPAGLAAALGARAAPPKQPVVKMDRDNLWSVEYYDGTDPVLPEDKVGLKDIVNFYQCKNCTLRVPMKVKGLSFLNCEKVTIVIGDVIGVCEITTCKRGILYMTGSCKSVTCDKCDNLQINLNEQSLDAQITCALSQGLNVEIPDLTNDGNMIEFPVPEQIRVSIKDRKLVHEVYVHE